MLSLVVNFGGIAYYVNQDRKTAQTIHELGQTIEELRVPPPPIKSATDLKYVIEIDATTKRLEKLLNDLAVDHSAFKKYAEPKLEKLDKLRR